jgi:hypothetical protein
MAPTSPANFRLIADAFEDYAKQVGLDLTKNPLAEALQACDSPKAVLELLQKKAQAFKDYRDGNRSLLNWLNPVVHVVHGFSGVIGQAISFVSQTLDPCLFHVHSSTRFRSRQRVQYLSAWIFSSVYISHSILCIHLSDIQKHQAAIGVSSSYDSLVDLFECLGNFLKRLEIYTTMPVTPLMTDIIVKIMVELLSVLALATKQVQQGRLSEWILRSKS